MVAIDERLIDFRFGPRHTDRHFRRGFGASVIKNLTELITNSDTEYWAVDWDRQRGRPPSFYGGDIERLVNESFPKEPDPSPIIVVADSRKRRFRVIDHGRGFPDEKMTKTVLRAIGEDMAQVLGEEAEPKRSLFGEGLSAVMWIQKKGNIKSIVDDHLHELQVREDKEGVRRWTSPRVSKRRVQQNLRAALRIPRGNGTVVEFELDRRVRKYWPTEESLLSWLNNYWALRLINLDPRRQIRLIYVDSSGDTREYHCAFQFPRQAEQITETLDQGYEYAGRTILVEGRLWRAATPLHTGPSEERRNGLLVIDENDACYDLQFFGFDQNEHTSRLFGVLKLTGAGQLVRELTNQGEEVLKDDRDGFNRRHPFYRWLLEEVVNPWLKPIVERERRNLDEPGRASAKVNRLLGKALKEINKVFEELTEPEDEPSHGGTDEDFHPKDGLEFVGSKQRTASVGATTILTLAVDPSRFSELPSVDIALESQGGAAEVFPQEVPLDDPELGRAFIRVTPTAAGQAKISAIGIRDDEEVIETTVRFTFQEEHTPEIPNGIRFDPDTSRIAPNRRHALRLYADLERVPLGTDISLGIDSEPGDEDRVVLEVDRKAVVEEHRVLDSVAKVPFYVIGYAEGPAVAVTARTPDGLTASAIVEVGQRLPPAPGNQRFGLPEYRALEGTKRRTQWDNDPTGTGAIIINALDPVNRAYFGDSAESFQNGLDNGVHARLLLAELMMEEILLSTYTRAEDDGKVGASPTKAEATRNYLAAAREKYGTVLHDALLSRSTLRELGVLPTKPMVGRTTNGNGRGAQ